MLLLCGILALLSPRPCNATPEPSPAIPDAVPIDAGQAAPFDGVVLSTEDAVTLWEKLENLEGRAALEKSRCGEKLSIEYERCFKQMTIAKSASDAKIDMLKKAFARCEVEKHREWWENPAITVGGGAVAGVVVGIVLTAGAVWLGAQARVVVQ